MSPVKNPRVESGPTFVAGCVLVAALAIAMGLRLASAHGAAGPSGPTATSAVAGRAPSAATLGPGAAPDASAVTSRRVALGRKIFFDARLSEPPGTSCASCHDPAHGFAGNNGSTNGVALGSRPGHFARRNTPSVLYMRFVRKFHLHWEEDAPLVDAYAGFFWDGRVDSLEELSKQPLFNPDEMNATSAALVAQKIHTGEYADDFRAEFDGADDPDTAIKALGEAIDAFLRSPEMSPFSSRYDDYVRGRAQLTPVEARGLALFKDSAKGGCSACHKLNDRSPDPAASLFTDYSFDGVGAPRNRALPATKDATYYDLGLCERAGDEYKAKTEEFCGRFRSPSLRNVALRPAFMHNGTFSKLRDVVAFYATRDTNPKRWYKSGVVFDDLPKQYRQNVNVDKAPYNRREGEKPALDDSEIDAVVAFLETLTDSQVR
jgi:cytochrome c peroxidase